MLASIQANSRISVAFGIYKSAKIEVQLAEFGVAEFTESLYL
jgi:hypothetical protein